MKILAIANSFSQDCMEYVYQILFSLGLKDIELGNLYIGGCSLETHCKNLRDDLPAYIYYTNTDGVWKETPAYKMGEALRSQAWDFIFTQQCSDYSGLADTYGDLDELMEYVKANVKNLPVYGWQMTWAYTKNSKHPAFANYGKDQRIMYEAIVNAVREKILPRTDITAVIPSGTAIQNAREIFGDALNRDGFHLSYGLGRYIAGLCVVKAVGLDIEGVTFAPDGVSEAEKKIAVAAVNAAYANPFGISKL